MYRIEVQPFVTFAEQQNFGTGRHVIASYRLRIISNVALGFFSQIGQIFFPGL